MLHVRTSTYCSVAKSEAVHNWADLLRTNYEEFGPQIFWAHTSTCLVCAKNNVQAGNSFTVHEKNPPKLQHGFLVCSGLGFSIDLKVV